MWAIAPACLHNFHLWSQRSHWLYPWSFAAVWRRATDGRERSQAKGREGSRFAVALHLQRGEEASGGEQPFVCFLISTVVKVNKKYLCFLVFNWIIGIVVYCVHFQLCVCFVSGYWQRSGAAQVAWAAVECGQSSRNQWFGIWEQGEGSGQQPHLRGAVF